MAASSSFCLHILHCHPPSPPLAALMRTQRCPFSKSAFGGADVHDAVQSWPKWLPWCCQQVVALLELDLPRHIVGRTAAAPLGLSQLPATVVWPSVNPKTKNRGTFSPRPSYQQGRSIGDAASQTHSWKDCRGPSGAGPASSYCGLAERQPTKWIIEAPSPRAPAAQNLLICKQCVQTALANASPPFGRAGGSPSPQRWIWSVWAHRCTSADFPAGPVDR